MQRVETRLKTNTENVQTSLEIVQKMLETKLDNVQTTSDQYREKK